MAPADVLAGPSARRSRAERTAIPTPEAVKSVAPPMASAEKNPRSWTTFVGDQRGLRRHSGVPQRKHAYLPSGSVRTRTTHQAVEQGKVYDGLVGGWMPAVRKVIPLSEGAYREVIVFGDVEANDKFIVQTWHRTAQVENGKVTKVAYGYSYPAFPAGAPGSKPEEFYRHCWTSPNIGTGS